MSVEATSCANNCKQIGVALLQYSNDFNEWILPARTPSLRPSDGLASNQAWVFLLGNWGLYSPCDYGLRICSLGNNYYKNAKSGIGSGTVIVCPSQKISGKFIYTDYAINTWLFGIVGNSTYVPHKITQITNPSVAKYLFDNGDTGEYGISYVLESSGAINIDFRHLQRTNVLYADGHVNSAKYADLTSLGTHNGTTELLQGFIR